MNTLLLPRCNLIHVTKMTYWCFEWYHDMRLHLMTNCVTEMQTHLVTIMSYTQRLWRVYPAAQGQGVSAFKLELELIQYKIDFDVWWSSNEGGGQAWMTDCLVTVCIVSLVFPFWNIFMSCLRHHITQYAQRSNSATTAHACTDDNILSFKSFPNKSLPTNTIYHLNCQAIQILVQMFLLF